jgi:putative addiction module killer protein
MSIQVGVYEDERGARPFEEWFDQLPATHAAKVTTAVVRLEGGNRSGLKPVGEGVSEGRIDWGPGIRIYLAFDGTKLIILLGGGSKSRQQADIARAHQRWADYKQRKKAKE